MYHVLAIIFMRIKQGGYSPCFFAFAPLGRDDDVEKTMIFLVGMQIRNNKFIKPINM